MLRYINKPLTCLKSRLFILISLVVSAPALALPEQCIESPSRNEPCPNLIYKRAAHIDSELADRGVICLCLTDFRQLLAEPQSEQERINRDMQLQQMEAMYGIDADILLKLARY